MTFRLVIVLLFFFCFYPGNCTAGEPVRVLGPQSIEDVGHDYFLALLDLVLKKSEKDYGTAKIDVLDINKTTHGRSLILLDKGGVDVFWAGTTPEREQRFIPIRVPLFFGFAGLSRIHHT